MESTGFPFSFVLAYIDPGVGSILIQVLVAGLVGALFAIKRGWHQITTFFALLLGRKSPRAPGEDADPS
jgi:hypothetical protein